MKDLQQAVDELTYPPTHTYTLKPLAPTGLLTVRFENLRKIAPTFFDGRALLDIGASKGFYDLWAAKCGFKVIVAIEPQEAYADLLRQLFEKSRLPSAVVAQEKFGVFCKARRPLLPTFDRILITNVPHYLFGEYGGWGWWKDIAALCCAGAQVVIEGPSDMRDKGCFVPKLAPELEAQYNTGSFFKAPLEAGFELCGTIDSPRPTSDRCLMLFVRRGAKHSPGDCRTIQRESLQISRLWRDTKTKYPHRIYQTTCGLFCKEDYELSLDPEYHLNRLRVASKSPFTTPIEAFIYDGDTLVGWAEPDLVDSIKWFKPNGPIEVSREEFRLALRAICLYQIGLAGDGYLDLDNGAGNWGATSTGRMYTCDKGAVYPFDGAARGFQVPANYSMKDPVAFRDGSFWRLAAREYGEWLTKGHEKRISDAVLAGDVPAIERAFLQLYQAIGESP